MADRLCGANRVRAQAAWKGLDDERRARIEATALHEAPYPKGSTFEEEGRFLWAWLYARDLLVYGKADADIVALAGAAIGERARA